MKIDSNVRLSVLTLRKEGWSIYRIADTTGTSKSNVYRILQNEHEKNAIMPIRGRPRTVDAHMEKNLIKISRKNPTLTLNEILQKQQSIQKIHKSTLWRILHRNGVLSSRPNKKPFLSQRHRKDRLRFARVIKNLDWNDVIFSDEKRFRLRPDGLRRIWRHPGCARPIQQTEKFGGGSIMVWGAIRSDGRLIVLPCSDNMDRWEYQDIIEKAMDTGLFWWGNDVKVTCFQHDRAAPHRSAYTRAFFEFNHIDVLDWPAQSQT